MPPTSEALRRRHSAWPLAALVRDGIALAAPAFAAESACLLIATPGGPIEHIDLTGRTLELLTGAVGGEDGWLAAYFANYQRNHARFKAKLDAIGGELWELFVRDLDAALDARGVVKGGRLVLLPQGALGLLPIGLARNPETGELLSDCYELSLATCASRRSRGRWWQASFPRKRSPSFMARRARLLQRTW